MPSDRQLRELRSLTPWNWDTKSTKHPPGQAALRDFERIEQAYLSQPGQGRTRQHDDAVPGKFFDGVLEKSAAQNLTKDALQKDPLSGGFEAQTPGGLDDKTGPKHKRHKRNSSATCPDLTSAGKPSNNSSHLQATPHYASTRTPATVGYDPHARGASQQHLPLCTPTPSHRNKQLLSGGRSSGPGPTPLPLGIGGVPTPAHLGTHTAAAGSPVLEDQLEGCEAGPASGRGSRGTELQHSSPPQDGSALLSAALGLDSAAATASRMLPPPTTGPHRRTLNKRQQRHVSAQKPTTSPGTLISPGAGSTDHQQQQPQGVQQQRGARDNGSQELDAVSTLLSMAPTRSPLSIRPLSAAHATDPEARNTQPLPAAAHPHRHTAQAALPPRPSPLKPTHQSSQPLPQKQQQKQQQQQLKQHSLPFPGLRTITSNSNNNNNNNAGKGVGTAGKQHQQTQARAMKENIPPSAHHLSTLCRQSSVQQQQQQQGLLASARPPVSRRPLSAPVQASHSSLNAATHFDHAASGTAATGHSGAGAAISAGFQAGGLGTSMLGQSTAAEAAAGPLSALLGGGGGVHAATVLATSSAALHNIVRAVAAYCHSLNIKPSGDNVAQAQAIINLLHAGQPQAACDLLHRLQQQPEAGDVREEGGVKASLPIAPLSLPAHPPVDHDWCAALRPETTATLNQLIDSHRALVAQQQQVLQSLSIRQSVSPVFGTQTIAPQRQVPLPTAPVHPSKLAQDLDAGRVCLSEIQSNAAVINNTARTTPLIPGTNGCVGVFTAAHAQ